MDPPKPLLVRVGLPGGAVHDFTLPPHTSISTLITHILSAENISPTSVRVRIICCGKLITDHSLPLSSVLTQGNFLHAAFSSPPPTPPPSPPSPEPSFVLSAVGTNGEVRILIPNLNGRSLQDLSNAGLNDDEIRAIRRQLRLLRHEEDEGPRFLLSAGSEGTNSDFLLGCIFGYLLGIIVLVLLLDNNATRRWRVGIVAGVATNCAFGILRTSLYLQGSLTTP